MVLWKIKLKMQVQVGLVKDLGLEYFENPKERLQWIKEPKQVQLAQVGKQ